MSLYKDASLAMIPSAYKDGKLYSIRPTDGSGDFTFSRGSNLAATRVDVNGLIEKGRENLFLNSSDLSASTWRDNAGVSTANATTAPDGSNNAIKFIPNSATTFHYVHQDTPIVVINGGVVCFSIYVKRAGYDYVLLNTSQGSSNGNAGPVIDLVNGKVVNNYVYTYDVTIETAGNDWWRVSYYYKTNVSATNVDFNVLPSSSITAYSGDGTSGVFMWGAQLEYGLVATDYIETGASTAQAGILEDMPRLDYSGGASCPSLLLEPQRTNSVLHSEYYAGYPQTRITLTHNAATSPEGVNNATKMVETTDTGLHFLSLNGSVTSSSNVAFSIFAKQGENQFLQVLFGTGQTSPEAYANVDLSNGTYNDYNMVSFDTEDYGNGWYRIFGVVNPSVTSLGFYIASVQSKTAARAETYTGDGVSGFYLYGGQIESSASYPTSYIPTYGSSVTRSFDNAGTRTDMQDFLGTDTGAWFMHLDEFYFDITGTGLGSIILAENGQQAISIELIQDGQFQYKITLNNSTAISNLDGEDKLIMNWSSEFFKIFINGVESYSSTSSQWSNAFTHLILPQTTRAPHIKIKQMLFFPTALTDSECIALTTL